MSNNLSLWNAVFETDPRYTKSFDRSGGFSGTAINFTYLMKKATAVFGPFGASWGVTVLDEKYVQGHRLDDAQHAIVHVVRIRLHYTLDGKQGSIESFGQTTFVGKNKHGVFTDEEAPKKSLTDAMSKALSWLGFGGDVHMGLYDDNKYVSAARRSTELQEVSSAPDWGRLHGEWMTQIGACQSVEALKLLKDAIFAACKEHKDAGGAAAWAGISGAIAERLHELRGAQPAEAQ